MKRCPTCQKTFDDAMRFCQTDGTPLVADEAPADPYKTMVASADDIKAALRSSAEPESTPPPAVEAGPASADEEPLQIPSEPISSSTPASELKTRIAQSSGHDEAEVIEIPPLAEQPPSNVPSFNEPSPAAPSFGAPPPSPFADSASEPAGGPGDFPTTPPIPSPFGASNRSKSEQTSSTPKVTEPEAPAPAVLDPEPSWEPASTPQFAEPEPPASPAFNPFEAQAAAPSEPLAQAEWTPPPSPASSYQNQPGGTNMQSPPPAAGQSQTLAIVSLVLGILSCLCCFSIITGPIAAILGFMARGKATKDPAHFGGAGLAIGGIITGVIGILVGIGQLIYVALNFALIMAQMGAR